MEGRPVIRVWRFDDAPAEWRELSNNGGDEDWLAHVPAHLVKDWIPWLEEGSRVGFGVCAVNEYLLPDGSVIRIGVHA